MDTAAYESADVPTRVTESGKFNAYTDDYFAR